jgi:hypothetical protein
MADRYFDKFPLITYSNNTIVDLTKRVALLDRVSKNPYAFYNYDIEDNERPDQLSNRYYEDSYLSWLVYLTNQIVDPYYEWYMTNDELEEFIEKKYGSIYDAQQKIKFYRNNWENQENISVSAYNALSINRQKYWNPEYGAGSTVISYKRKELDWSSSTNKIISYTVSNTSFIENEICEIKINNTSYGKGQFVNGANNVIYLQHVSGDFADSVTLLLNENSYVYGTESQANTIVTNIFPIANNIPEDELIYWKGITYYEYEVEKNEFNKSIRVVDKDQRFTAVDNLIDLLKE